MEVAWNLIEALIPILNEVTVVVWPSSFSYADGICNPLTLPETPLLMSERSKHEMWFKGVIGVDEILLI